MTQFPPAGAGVRLLRRVFLPVSLLTLAAAALYVPLPVFLETPRAPYPLAAAVEVGVPGAAEVNGDYLLTAVSLRRATIGDLAVRWIDDETRFLPVEAVLPPGVGDGDYFDGQREVFADSADVAAAVGLEEAGLDAIRGAGALVASVREGSPAEGRLREGDVVVAVDGDEVETAADLARLVRDTPPGGDLRLTVARDDRERTVTLTPRPLTGDAPQIGVGTDTVDLRIDLPVDVEVDGGRIGGPSAGLLIALTVLDRADDRDVAAGRTIAGTGALSVRGDVEPIGGLPLKVVSAARAGADVFLAPADQAADARGAVPAGSDMRVVGVATFDEAVAALAGEPA